MARLTIGQTYTYYRPGVDPEIRAREHLAGKGVVWVLGEYKPPSYPSPLNVRVGDAGIKVWMVIQWLEFCEGDVDRMIERYGHVLTRTDVEAALWFYKNNPVDRAEIDRKIAAEAE